MKIALPTETLRTWVVLDRGGRDFVDRDRAVLDTVGPHLGLIHRRHVHRSGSIGETTAQRLSAREREVLDLVARGWTNREIGAALFIASGTVRKHLDNVYTKLGVSRRAQAAALVVGRGAAPSLGEDD